MDQKKIYTPPRVTKVQLVVKDSVLGTCHSSPVQTPRTGNFACSPDLSCWTGPTP